MVNWTGFRTGFRRSKYNWFGQKLLAQHRYSDIIGLCTYLDEIDDEASSNPNDTFNNRIRYGRLSEHLRYVNVLALMKTSVNLDDLVLLLQQLSFNKNSQYFLLLCQCLMYLGNYDSIVELCKQVIGNQINVIGSAPAAVDNDSPGSHRPSKDQTAEAGRKESSGSLLRAGLLMKAYGQAPADDDPNKLLRSISEDATELNKVMDCIQSNPQINDSRLWFIFGLALEHQMKLRDANAAFEVSIKLANRYIPVSSHHKANAEKAPLQVDALRQFMHYAEFCIKYKQDYRAASKILASAISTIGPLSNPLSPLTALTLVSQPTSNKNQFMQALDLVSSVEALLIANKNPSQGYNQLAFKFQQKLKESTSCYFSAAYKTGNNTQGSAHDQPDSALGTDSGGDCCFAADECQYSGWPGLGLAKSHIAIGNWIQDSGFCTGFYEVKPLQSHEQQTPLAESIYASQLNNMIDFLKSCPINDSPALWNNLGLCYLMKRKFVACLSCLMQAYRYDQLDWRINFNLALAYLHIGLAHRALTCLFAARELYSRQRLGDRSKRKGAKDSAQPGRSAMINLLIAISFDMLGDHDEARRNYIDTVFHKKSTVLAIVNYIAFLHRTKTETYQHESLPSDPTDESTRDTKLTCRLLDHLETLYLQRDPDECQFNIHLLSVAENIVHDEMRSGGQEVPQKTYAWSKSRKGSDNPFESFTYEV